MYMRLLTTLTFLLISSLSYGQGIWNQVNGNSKFWRLKADSVIIVPRDTSATNNAFYLGAPVGDSGRLAHFHGRFWGRDNTKFRSFAFSDEIPEKSFINPITYGATPNDGISDRAAIQSAINASVGRYIVVSTAGQWDIDSTIIIPGGTTWILQDDAKIFLLDSSNCNMVANLNKTTSSDRVIKDSLITISGGQWYGNGDEQIKFMPDGSPVSGFWFSGVKNVTLSPKKIFNTQTYAFEITNCESVIVENVEIDQGADYNPPLHNQDGVHFDGPAKNIIVRNIIARTWDDAVAICTESVPVGPYQFDGRIDGVLIDNILLNSTRKGIRLLSADSSLNNVIVSNITGSSIDNVFEASGYGLGPGAFGSIILKNVEVTMIGTPISVNEYISFSDKINSILVDGVRRTVTNDIRQTVHFKASADIVAADIRNVTTFANTTNSFSDIQTSTGAKIGTLNIANHTYKGGTPSLNNAIQIAGLTSGIVRLSNLTYDSVKRGVLINTSTIKRLELNDNTALNADSSVHINNTSTVDTLSLNGNILRDSQLRAFIVNGSTVSKIKAYLPVESSLGGTATNQAIKYTSSNANFTLNPQVTLQDVTANTVATTNMIKGTGLANLKNGSGWELFYDAGTTTGTFQTFDRGGTNTLLKTLIQGVPIMMNSRVLVGVNVSTTDNGNTTLQVKGSVGYPVLATAGSTSLTAAHHIVRITNSAHTITLPPAASYTGTLYRIRNESAGGTTVSSVLIDGVSTTTIPANTAWTVYSDGTNWRLFSN